jgi:hypothetical protein
MLRVYFNYPNAQVTVHKDGRCASVQQQRKEGQRRVQLNIRTISNELSKLSEKAYRFASQAELNDMWLDIDFNDEKFERALVDYVRVLLAQHYKPFAGVKVSVHC